MLVFHPRLFFGTLLGQNIENYTFFSYHSNEALQLSIREKQKVLECIDNIRQELQHAIDLYSKELISKYIELLLDHCTRFYTRQFITRSEANKKILTKFEDILFKRTEVAKKQLIHTNKTTSQIAEELGYSTPQLFSYLFKKIVGYTPNEFRILN